MVAITKPDFENIWATEGGVGTPSLDQILSGWKQNQFPPSEFANYLQNRIETAIQYLYQVGISDWDRKIEYQKTSLVKFGGKHYLAKEVNIDKRPDQSSPNWVIAFDAYGASDDLRNTVTSILGVDGFLPFYVRKNDPVMLSKAKAPSFEADVVAGVGYTFKGYASGLSCNGGDLLLTSGGVVNGRVKNTPPTLEMNDDTLVTTALLKKVVDDLARRSQIPVGWSVVTNSSNPPSHASQLGYGTWVMDVQGRALVGVSTSTALNDPEWIKDCDSRSGDWEKTITEKNLPEHAHNTVVLGRGSGDLVLGQAVVSQNRNESDYNGYIMGGTALEPNAGRTSRTGGGIPLNVVQPSHTKYIWTRTV